MHPGLTKAFTAGAAITKRRLVKLSASGVVILAAAATDFLLGVSDMSADVASGDRVDVRLTDVAEVEAGAAIVRGSMITSDATGRAVTAAPAAGVNNRVIGIAINSAAAAGDIIDVLLEQGQVQG